MKPLPQTLLVLAVAFGLPPLVAAAAVHYVDLNSTNATPPYTNWATAATNIQDAVDAAVAGDEVVVTNGTYVAWLTARDGSAVTVNKPLSLRSVNGPQFTSVAGGGLLGRCVFLTNGASLSGFTLSGGYAEVGGGAYGGTLNNCALINNQSSSGYGGGAAYCTLHNCTLRGNEAHISGGGTFVCTLNNCTLIGNSAFDGGGARQCSLNNCTLVGNSASAHGTDVRGGARLCIVNNCIAFGNSHEVSVAPGGYRMICEDCDCPGHLGDNNWFGDPLFVDNAGADLHLQSNSPCINAGNNAYAPGGPDLDGNPRILGGTVDIGAYEFQSPVSQISYSWLQQFGLPINSSTDTADPDGDAVDNYHEWLAGTDPTNPLSSPAQLTITPSGVPSTWIILVWSTNAVGFTLQSTINPFSPSAWVTNSSIPVVTNGQNTVTNPIAGPQQFYRLAH